MNHELDDFIYLLDKLNSVYDKVIVKQFIRNLLWQLIGTVSSSFLLSESGSVVTLKIVQAIFSS